ncbi:MAG: ParA family protein [Candidatus Marinimicrobia bacterium]|nr:ParA family protein [Candidatus Neomarinimicrobiota bacterium]MBT4035326.1 ParA family protein [Candidatus Neomarinimicrobiota bacterium]MBT4359701.1 ParA family protein [Candidatus Neomarinimicrobiota bacterium]MBT4713713.1 ParA family protein [Candidatus Neomarinimicrobiota bacterium]MBT4946935.1 ParA family protein [Candidatus Neomarinimicrobiota bacterium]
MKKSLSDRVTASYGRMTINDLRGITRKSSAEILEDIATVNGENPAFEGRRVSPVQSRSYLKSRGYKFPFKSVAFINLKGGVGKTVSAITLSTRAQQLGFQTALLDLDSQASSTLALDCRVSDDNLFFMDTWEDPAGLPEALVQVREGLFLLPSSLYNGMLDTVLNTPNRQKKAVSGSLMSLQNNKYDLAVIDCPPSLGTAVISTIAAVDTVVIPVTSDAFALHGLELTLGEIKAICSSFGVKKPQIKILFTKFDKRETLSSKTYEFLIMKYPKMLIPDPIPISTQFSKALDQNASIFETPGQYPAKKQYDLFIRNLLGLKEIL